MAYSNDDTKNQVKNATDIVELIGNYIELKPAGHARHKALCPFHQEKTPSFTVNQDKQSFFCFGCEKGGDVFTFLQEIDGLNFREALQTLADKAGIRLPEYKGNSGKDNQRKQLLDLGKFASRLYTSLLKEKPQRNIGQHYLATRHLSAQTIESFGLGYVPEAWGTLCDAARKQGFIDNVLEASGMAKRGDRGNLYDLFRNRLIVPIRDASGNYVAFGGRALGDEPAKYINSPESAVYKKSNVLYGLYEARNALREKKSAFLVEGYFDALRLFDSGIENVVATCGTALTPAQAKLIKRYAGEVVVVYDGDTAGIRAALRSVGILTAAGLSVRAMILPDGQDPDDYILKAGAEIFMEMAKNAPGFVPFYARTNEERCHTIEGRTQVANELFEIVRDIDDPIRQDEYIKLIARELRLDEHRCREQYRRGGKPQPSHKPQQHEEFESVVKINDYDRDFLAALCQHPEWMNEVREKLSGLKLPNTPLCQVLAALLQGQEADTLTNRASQQLYYAAQNAEKTWKDDGKDLVDRRIMAFKQEYLKRQSEKLEQELHQTQDKEKQNELFKAIVDLKRKIEDNTL